MEYPYLLDRVKAVMLIILVFMLFSYLLELFDTVPTAVRVLVYIGCAFIYEPLMVSSGGTIGHRLMGLKVKKVNDFNKNLSFGIAIVRFIIKAPFGWLSMFTLNDKSQALHDLATKSIVLYNNSNTAHETDTIN